MTSNVYVKISRLSSCKKVKLLTFGRSSLAHTCNLSQATCFYSTRVKNSLFLRNCNNLIQSCIKASPNFVSRRLGNISSGISPDDDSHISTECDDLRHLLTKDMRVIYDFVTEEEELSLHKEIEPHLKRLKYESSHWDDAIHGYREVQRKQWTEKNKEVIQRIRDIAFPPGVKQLSQVHVLDLKKEGYIKPHVDAVRFCGNTIAGISLLSSAVMRLVHTEDKTKSADILLKRRSLYIMKDEARYNFTHEILMNEDSVFEGQPVVRDRRISVICRNEP